MFNITNGYIGVEGSQVIFDFFIFLCFSKFYITNKYYISKKQTF